MSANRDLENDPESSSDEGGEKPDKRFVNKNIQNVVNYKNSTLFAGGTPIGSQTSRTVPVKNAL